MKDRNFIKLFKKTTKSVQKVGISLIYNIENK